MHLITGRGSQPHVTAENDALRNATIFGNSRYVINFGENFGYTIEDNVLTIKSGYGYFDGRFFELPAGETKTFEIGEFDMNSRGDALIVRYTKNTDTGIESLEMLYILDYFRQENYYQNNILEGDTIVDMVLYKRYFSFMPYGVQFERVAKIYKRIEERLSNALVLRETFTTTINTEEGMTSVIPTDIEVEMGDVPIIQIDSSDNTDCGVYVTEGQYSSQATEYIINATNCTNTKMTLYIFGKMGYEED